MLTRLGLDPALPTFYHNARFAVHHKGQVELFRAVDRALEEGAQANFIIRCLSDAPLSELFTDIAARHPSRIHLESARVDDKVLMQYAASSDFCLFPSKFEMDTFLIAQGEAMAAGAVPIATAQLGMGHYGHVADPVAGPDRDTATGFAVGRSFAEDDAILVAALADRIHTAIRLWHDQPKEYARLSANAVANARTFTWNRCAQQHLEAFRPLWNDQRPVLSVPRILEHGWFGLLEESAWAEYADEIADAARHWGDLEAYQRCRDLTPHAVTEFFEAAWQRADIAACAAAARHSPDLAERLRARYDVGANGLRYRMPHAARIDLVVPGTPAGSARVLPSVVPLVKNDGEFRHPAPPQRPLHLLITLNDGRCAWDVIDDD